MSPSIRTRRPTRRLLAGGVGMLVGTARAVGFWATVLFPLVYALGYLAVSLDPDLAVPSMSVLGPLLAANVLALVVGHGYERPARSPSRSDGVPDRRSSHGD